MFGNMKKSSFGFTLVELAIVLAVAGIMFGGLYRLLSGSNAQLRDQAAASSQQQLINAVKGFLASSAGQAYMASNKVTTGSGGCSGGTNPSAAGYNYCAANSTFTLPIPGSGCTLPSYANGDPDLSSFCSFLPPGLTSATTNPYGQTYSIQILRDGTLNPNTTYPPVPPVTYSFMIVTTLPASNPTVIPDTDGGRISSLIGGDGGFIYTSAVCTSTTGDAASTNASAACGSYGAWATDTSYYGFGASGVPATSSGTVVSRSYVSGQNSSLTSTSTGPWLERNNTPVNPTESNFNYHTMAQDLYMGVNMEQPTPYPPSNIYMANNTISGGSQATAGNIYMAGSPTAGFAATSAGGSLYMIYKGYVGTSGGIAPGVISMQGGTINLADASGTYATSGVINLDSGTINGPGYFTNTLFGNAAAVIDMEAGTLNMQGGQINLGGTAANSTSIVTTIPAGDATTTAINLTQNEPTGNPLLNAQTACTITQFNTTTNPPTPLSSAGTFCNYAINTSSINVSGVINANSFYANGFIYQPTSDRRLKKDIHPLVDALQNIMRLKPVSYILKTTGAKSMGVIAQDLQEVYPQLVSGGGNDTMYVNYDGLIGPLIGAVQDLKKENDSLRQELEAQKLRQDKLEEEISQH